jgi:starch synthase
MKFISLAFIDFNKEDAVKSHVFELHKSLQKSKKFEICDLYCIGTGSPNESDDLSLLNSKEVIKVRFWFFRIIFYNLYVAYFFYFKLISNYKYIYIRFNPYFYILLLLIKLKKPNLKIFIEINGIFEEEFVKDNLYYYLYKKFHIIIERHMIKLSNGQFCVTQELKDYLVQSFSANQKNILVVPNGVNIQSHRKDENCRQNIRNFYGIREDSLVFGFIGNFAGWQGLDLTIKAFKSAKFRTDNVRLMLVGDGPDLYYCKELIHKLKKGNEIIVTGQVPISKSSSYVSAFDIGILLKKPIKSGYSPLKLYSYLACGVPVIATNLKSFNFLESNEIGWLVENNISDIALKFEFLESNFSKDICISKQRSDRCKNYVSINHNWDVLALVIANSILSNDL